MRVVSGRLIKYQDSNTARVLLFKDIERPSNLYKELFRIPPGVPI